MKIVESERDFDEFIGKFRNYSSVIVPIQSDVSAHPAVNTVCALFVRLWEPKKEDYFLPFNHSEAVNLPEPLLRMVFSMTGIVYTPSKKTLMHLLPVGINSVDLKGIEYFQEGSCVEEDKFYTPFMKNFYGKHHEVRNLNRIVPMMQLVKFCEDYLEHLDKYVIYGLTKTPDFKFHNSVVLPACHFMEEGGVYVDSALFEKFYGNTAGRNIVNGLVYTEYNPYTAAGRVTNKHGGINYAAIEKKNGTRSAYVSRHTKGAVVMIDFESFHLRMIAEQIGYDLPDMPTHEYLARQYFETETLTPEQYEEGKNLTFQFLYSDRQEGKDYPFFARVYEFFDNVWKEAQTVGYYESATERRIYLNHMEYPSPAKLFNYILQLRETEVAMQGINDLRKVFNGKQSKVVLYTYDSIMIDYSFEDGKALLLKTKEVLTKGGKYPVRIYVGDSYQTLKNVTDKIK